MVYNPATTTLLRQAAAQGKTTVSGTRMFLAQAARQFEIWTDSPRHERFMPQSKRTTFRIPASTANLGAGFDALGLGLARYLRDGCRARRPA